MLILNKSHSFEWLFKKRVIFQVIVLNSKKTILINPNARFTQKDVNALIEHEIGVQMVTTQNSI